MNILAIDTTSRHASLAVLQEAEILIEYNFSSADNVSTLLIPSLEFLLKSLKLTFEDIDLYGIGVGPGLFTGIRIGLATLKGLLFGRRQPLVPVVTLHALAYKFKDDGETVVPLIDARRHEVYLGAYRFAEGEFAEMLPPQLAAVPRLGDVLAGLPEKIFVGSGAENHKDWLKKLFPESVLHYRSNFLATEIGRIAFREFHKNNYLTDPQQLLPFYIRQPDVKANPISAALPDAH